jgi:hypothetical protein
VRPVANSTVWRVPVRFGPSFFPFLHGLPARQIFIGDQTLKGRQPVVIIT